MRRAEGTGGTRSRCCGALLARAEEAERLGMRRVARALVRDAAAMDLGGDRRLALRVAASMMRHGIGAADFDD